MSEESIKFFLVRKKNELLTVRMIKLQCKDNSETFFNAIKLCFTVTWHSEMCRNVKAKTVFFKFYTPILTGKFL